MFAHSHFTDFQVTGDINMKTIAIYIQTSRHTPTHAHNKITQIQNCQKINCFCKVMFKYLISDYMQHCISLSALINTLISIICLLTVWKLKILRALPALQHTNVIYCTHIRLFHYKFFGRVSECSLI